jgi:tRNA (guanine37-N1)-methyltransferase
LIKFYILTLFPDFFESFCNHSIIKKGLQKNAFKIIIKNIRDNAVNKYGQVDDLPYGGGSGMLIRPEPVIESLEELKVPKYKKRVIFFSPKGKIIDYNSIINLTKYRNIVLICGHYEGIDQRVIDKYVDEEISLGDFVLTGGELPAMVLIDAVIRQIKGVIKEASLCEESYTNNLLEYRQYTRPAVYKKMKVPDILLSGNHKNIEDYRIRDSIRETLLKRSDLIDNNLIKFDNKTLKLINEIREEINNGHNSRIKKEKYRKNCN